MQDREKALTCLEKLDPRALDYDQWLRVGLALKSVGASSADWERWSAGDPGRYHKGECAQKWESFRDAGTPVTLASLIALTQSQGNRLPDDFFTGPVREEDKFGWDDYIIHAPKKIEEAPVVVDPNYLEVNALPAPAKDFAPKDIIRYLQLMFEPSEYVGIVTDAWQKDDAGRWLPKKGFADKTCGALIEELRAAKKDVGAVLGDVHAEAGAWVRINPMDGTGEVRDSNVTAFRHALLEADSGDLETQLATIIELQLPCTCIVHSGGKSIHALVRVDAPDMAEYRKRVDHLYAVAKKNGIVADVANRNPSRLSRLPGVHRGKAPQYIIATKTGKASWQEWTDWIADLKDDLPDPVCIDRIWTTHPPKLAETLIDGVLRIGHKMLLTGPSKAGKSFGMQELTIAIAEGVEWLGWQCRQGNVLYVNLELDSASCEQRYIEIYKAWGIERKNSHRIDVWHLRGNTVPMDRLAPKLIRRAASRNYAAVIIDPIFKVITGDENSAEDMGKFCNSLDRVGAALKCSVIYAHHHSKGSQGGKRAIDRASGSGVFGRDPDALLDMIELTVSDERRKVLSDMEALNALKDAISFSDLSDKEPPDEAQYDVHKLLSWCHQTAPALGPGLANVVAMARGPVEIMTGWRLEATVREFATPPRRNVWFKYPIHPLDTEGLLQDAKAEGEEPPWMQQQRSKAKIVKERANQKEADILQAIESAGGVGKAEVDVIAERLGVTGKTVRSRVEKLTLYIVKNGIVTEKGAE